MAEEITNYTVTVNFESALKKLSNFEKKMNKFSAQQESSLKRQIRLQVKLNNLQMGMTKKVKPIPSANITKRVDNLPKQETNLKKSIDRLTSKLSAGSASKTVLADKMREQATTARANKLKNKTNFKESVEKLTPKLSAGSASKTLFADKMREAPKVVDNNAHLKEREAHLNRVYKARKREEKSLERAKDSIKNTLMYMKKSTSEAEKIAKARFKEAIGNAKNLKKLRAVVAEERLRLSVMKKQSFMARRISQSIGHAGSNMVSVFALAAGGASIAHKGQQFEGVVSGMKAVSASAEEAESNLKFVRDESLRLGKPLKESSDAFVKMLAARGNLDTSQVKDVFTSTQEVATVLGLSADQSNRGVRAISQMMSKGRVTAEELRLQLAEAGFANAIPEMVKAAQDVNLIDKSLGITEATSAFFKLQEQGKVVTDQILPAFSKRMKDFASPALADKLKTNAVAMGRMFNQFEQAADTIFKGGFGEGLTVIFNAIADGLRDNTELLSAIGSHIGSIFKIIGNVIDAVMPTIIALGSVVKGVTDLFGDATGYITLFGASLKGLSLLGGAAKFNPLIKVFTVLGSVIQDAAFWLEEIINAMTGGKIGVLNPTGEAWGLGFDNWSADKQLNRMGLNPKTGQALPPVTKSTQAPIQVTSTIVLPDGEKLAEVVGKTVSFENAAMGVFSPHFNGN